MNDTQRELSFILNDMDLFEMSETSPNIKRRIRSWAFMIDTRVSEENCDDFTFIERLVWRMNGHVISRPIINDWILRLEKVYNRAS